MNNEPNRDEILMAAANGNAQALEFLRVFARRAHWVDDLRDGDKLDAEAKYSTHEIAEEEANWLIMLSGNPFFLTHRAQLVPAMVLALNAWIDSDYIAERPDAQAVLKGQWHEVVWLVAWLTGGWKNLREATSRHRSFDFEAVKEPQSRGDAETHCVLCGRPKGLQSGELCGPCLGARWVREEPERKELNGLPGK